MSCEVPVTCRTVLGQSLGWGGFGGGDDPLRNPASGSFDRASTAADVTRGLDLRGRCYVLTGATGALGREVARALVRVGAHVIIAARSMARGSALAEELRRDGAGAGAGAATTVDRVNDAPSSPHQSPSSPRAPNDDDANSGAPKSPGDATVMLCDLASQDSVRSFARSFRRKALPLHGVLNCAAVILRPFELTPEGRESHFAVNHLGHFLLVNELLPELVATASVSGIQARVVNVTSAMHHFTYRVRRGRAGPSRGIDFTQLDDPRGYDPINAYAQSKLANILHAWQLNERFRQVPRGSVHSVGSRGGGGSFGGADDDDAAADENTAVRPVAAFAVHPGAFGRELRDNLSRNLPFGAGGVLFDVARSMSLGLVKTPEQAAATVLYCACLGSVRLYFIFIFVRAIALTPRRLFTRLTLFLFAGVWVHRRRVGSVRVLLRRLRRDEVFAAGEGPEAGAGAVGDERAAVRDGARERAAEGGRRRRRRRDVRRLLGGRGIARGGRRRRRDFAAPPRGFHVRLHPRDERRGDGRRGADGAGRGRGPRGRRRRRGFDSDVVQERIGSVEEGDVVQERTVGARRVNARSNGGRVYS